MRRVIGVITVLMMSQAAATAEPQQIDLDVPSATVASGARAQPCSREAAQSGVKLARSATRREVRLFGILNGATNPPINHDHDI